jgi:hypothetical protein
MNLTGFPGSRSAILRRTGGGCRLRHGPRPGIGSATCRSARGVAPCAKPPRYSSLTRSASAPTTRVSKPTSPGTEAALHGNLAMDFWSEGSIARYSCASSNHSLIKSRSTAPGPDFLRSRNSLFSRRSNSSARIGHHFQRSLTVDTDVHRPNGIGSLPLSQEIRQKPRS